MIWYRNALSYTTCVASWIRLERSETAYHASSCWACHHLSVSTPDGRSNSSCSGGCQKPQWHRQGVSLNAISSTSMPSISMQWPLISAYARVHMLQFAASIERAHIHSLPRFTMSMSQKHAKQPLPCLTQGSHQASANVIYCQHCCICVCLCVHSCYWRLRTAEISNYQTSKSRHYPCRCGRRQKFSSQLVK